MISYDEFQKMDIRIGKVLSAERVEGADKLLKMEVDIGDEKRQIVAGIAEKYEPESIVGKQFPFLANLEPKILRGEESKGMILLADMGDDFVFMLLPFIVGIYFFQVPYLDEEFARLFEEYYKYWAEESFSTAPTYHRVISVDIDKNIPMDFNVFPYEQATTILKDAKSFALYPCMCKLQKARMSALLTI